MVFRKLFFTFLVIVVTEYSCQAPLQDDDTLIAQVYDKKLYASDIDLLIPEDGSLEDSVLIKNSYLERWIKESVMMHEAEKNIPEDLEIDKLVSDYRASLIMHHYEKNLVEKSMDTAIAESQLTEYYEANKSQYLLESTIVRCRFIKLDKKIDRKSYRRFERIWEDLQSDPSELINEISHYNSEYLLNDSTWYRLEQIEEWVPSRSFNRHMMSYNSHFKFADENYFYFLRILESKKEREIAPLSFIKKQASQVILHQRKLELLSNIRDDLKERASSRNHIKIFN